jgi:chromosome segregation protein
MIRLKALELFGFKSFADRTRFDFPDGITVVVGPNGSGKSNVVDAIKWVLGEQSVRSLRGKEMADVIFAGSASRKPLNYAEVSLVFDNASGLLPARGSEVQIMRRVQRSGESEYLVNGETSRLRDIRELFSGTGAATEAYSVIEQGRVDAILMASGRDRRAVFEEAAGITRFRAKRAEALRRLERAEQNRQRLADIVGEVGSRLETVKHQAARARRWRQLTDRLRCLRLAAAGRDLDEVDTLVGAVEKELATARERLAGAETRVLAATEQAAVLTASVDALEPRESAVRAALTTASNASAAAEAMLAVARSRRHDFERDLGRARGEVQAALADAATAARAVAEATAAATMLEQECVDLDTRLAACTRAADGSQHRTADIRRRHAAALAELDQARAEQLRLGTARERADERADEARRAAAAAHQAVEVARRHQAALAEARSACEGALASVTTRLDAARGEIESLEAARRGKNEALRTAWGELAECRAKLQACGDTCTVLRDMITRQEGLSEAARRLLADSATAPPGLAGALADLLVSPVEWAALVDVALGELGQGIVVDGLADVVHWHGTWADGPAGREALAAGGRIRIVSADDLPPPPDYEPGPQPGLVGRLDRLLAEQDASATPAPTPPPSLDPACAAAVAGADTRRGHRRLRERLLGRVWVVDRLEQAVPLVAGAPRGTLFVARSGGCLSSDGLLELGTPQATSGLVARRSELRALEARGNDLRNAAEAARESIDSLQAEVDALDEAIGLARTRRQDIMEASATARADLDRLRRDQHAGEAALQDADRRRLAAEHAAAEAITTLRMAEEAAEKAAPAVEAAIRGVAVADEALNDLERSRGAIVEEIQRLQVERASRIERRARARDAVERCTATLEARRHDVATARREEAEAEKALEGHDLELLQAGGVQAETAWTAERAKAEATAIETERIGIESRRRDLTAAAEEARAEAGRVAAEVHRHDLEWGEARHRRVRILERIRDEYDIDLEAEPPAAAASENTASGDAAADHAAASEVPEDRTVLEAEIEQVRRKLGSYATVNLEALKEADELATRLATLEGQLADVTGAKDSIVQLIERIDGESRRLLGETIETVRGHFRELFERLFGGGQADILLEPEVDLLETAVEIVARPPGKEPRNISLLSGGEKTMTCVALLLAIFRSRPSPFCVLDEVDAALDEANVDRFVAVLRDFLSATQFIVVTHSKKTMAAATTLYGVTMEESGVSKRVSVRFESKVAAARAA